MTVKLTVGRRKSKVTISHLGFSGLGFSGLGSRVSRVGVCQPCDIHTACGCHGLTIKLVVFASDSPEQVHSLHWPLRHERRQGCLHRLQLANGISGACSACSLFFIDDLPALYPQEMPILKRHLGLTQHPTSLDPLSRHGAVPGAQHQ